MNDRHRKLVTIVCEARIEERLGADLLRLGAHGYTVTDARGTGSHGRRDGSWGPSANVRFEVVCDAETAVRIAEHARDAYSDDYALVLFLSEVEVLRPAKF